MKYVENITNHNIDGLLEIQLDTFNDNRGEIWSIYEDCELLPSFVEDKVTVSTKNVLRGLHGDFKISKLISCLHGSIFLAVVDIRKGSPTYKKIKTFELSDENPTMVLVPSGCLNGHLCISDKCVFFYKWSHKYNGPQEQITVRWNEPSLNIPWPTEKPILSERDLNTNMIGQI